MSNCQPNARLTVGRSPSRQLAVSWPAAGRRRGARTVRQDRANTSAQIVAVCLSRAGFRRRRRSTLGPERLRIWRFIYLYTLL